MNIYEFLEDFDNPDLRGHDWEEQMTEAVNQYYTEYPAERQMKPKNAINNYRSWKRDKNKPEE